MPLNRARLRWKVCAAKVCTKPFARSSDASKVVQGTATAQAQAHAQALAVRRAWSVLSWVGRWPQPTKERVGRLVSHVLANRGGSSVRTALYGMTLAWPNASAKNRHTLLLEYLQERAIAALDRVQLLNLDAAALRQKVHLRHADRLHAHFGREPTVVLCPPFVAAEAAGLRLALEGAGIALYQPHPNAELNAVLRQARQRFGSTLIPAGGSLGGLTKRLLRGQPLFLLANMACDADAAKPCAFFGQPVPAAPLAAWCAVHLHAKVMVVSAHRVGLRYEVSVNEPLSFSFGRAPSPSHDAVNQAQQQIHQAIEGLVRAAPAHFRWSHPRWLTTEGRPAAPWAA
jgi:Kdo2-lipid IVA lauroyltransferase/acyltransferase